MVGVCREKIVNKRSLILSRLFLSMKMRDFGKVFCDFKYILVLSMYLVIVFIDTITSFIIQGLASHVIHSMYTDL